MDDHSERKLLARVPGEILAGGSHMLPNPATDTEEFRDVKLDVQGIGVVLVIYERKVFTHYNRHSYRNWQAIHAVLVQSPEQA